MVISSNLLLT